MARVVLTNSACRAYTGGVAEFETPARSIRALVRDLESRFPGLGHQVEESMALAIDGVMYQDDLTAEIAENAEVYLLPRIGGG